MSMDKLENISEDKAEGAIEEENIAENDLVIMLECCVRKESNNFHKLTLHIGSMDPVKPNMIMYSPLPNGAPCIMIAHTNITKITETDQIVVIDHVHSNIHGKFLEAVSCAILNDLPNAFASLHIEYKKIEVPQSAEENVLVNMVAQVKIGDVKVVIGGPRAQSEAMHKLLNTKFQIGPIEDIDISPGFWCTESTCQNNECGTRVHGEVDGEMHGWC